MDGLYIYIVGMSGFASWKSIRFLKRCNRYQIVPTSNFQNKLYEKNRAETFKNWLVNLGLDIKAIKYTVGKSSTVNFSCNYFP